MTQRPTQGRPARRSRARITALAMAAALLSTVPVVTGAAPAGAQVETATWVEQNPSRSPTGRDVEAMATNPVTGELVLFGGWDGAARGDTWTWDGLDWTDRTGPGGPSARYGAAMAPSPSSGGVVLFGGTSPAVGHRGDTWVWNGLAWSPRTPATTPGARRYHAMEYHAATGQVVLFGGYNGTFLGDTWTWDGLTWSSRGSGPSGRELAAMAYDPLRGETVVFGGRASGTVLGDTWAWNGTTWTRRSPSTAPAHRWGAAMAFDPVSGQVVLFGGHDGSTRLDDTWAWDGNAWTQLDPSTNPSARYLAGMTQHPTLGRPVLFSGNTGTTRLDDTWAYTVEVDPQPVIDELNQTVDDLIDEIPDPEELVPPPIGFPSDDCDAGSNVMSGYVDGVFLKLRETSDPSDPGTRWVCVAFDDGASHLGGKLVVAAVPPGLPAAVDEDAHECGENANNENVQSGFILGEPYSIDVTSFPAGSSDALWVCASWGDTVGVRLLFAGPGANPIDFEPDSLDPHPQLPPDVWPVAGEPSAECRTAPESQQVRVANVTVGEDARLAVAGWNESSSRTHLCFRASDGTSDHGGRLRINSSGSLGADPVSDLGPCSFPVLTGSNPVNHGVHTSDPQSGSLPASVCLEVGSLVTGVTVTGQQGVVSFHPDTN